MFNINEFLEFLDDLGRYKESKRLKKMKGYLTSDDYFGWLFCSTVDKVPNLEELSVEMYELLTKKKALNTIIDTIEEYGVEKFSRTTATLLFTIAKYAVDSADESAEAISNDRREDKISKSEARDAGEKLEKIRALAATINSYAGKIIKDDAKILSRKSGMPREICIAAFKLVPDPMFIPTFRLPYFVDTTLQEIYKRVDAYDTDIDDIDWTTFFKVIFERRNNDGGYQKKNIYDIATFILLEGVGRIKGLGSKNTRIIWDSLTSWALRALDRADPQTQEHMLDIYVKKIDSMFKNGTPELRVNLLAVGKKEFPKLADAISGYKDRIEAIVNK